MNDPRARGFSLIELLMVVFIFGLLIALSVPAYRGFRETENLKSARDNIVGQLRLAREKAIATRQQQEVRFVPGFGGADYHVWDGVVADPKWNLPEGISYQWGAGTWWRFRMQPNGRCLESGMIIVKDSKGQRDTVSVSSSGMIASR